MIDKVTFTKETIEKVTWQALKEYKEFAQTLCIDNDKIFLGSKPIYGTERGVEPPIDDFTYPSVCEHGEVIGRIHSHVEEYNERPPFDKGSSNVDIFGVAKEGLNRLIKFPRLECVVSPTYDKKGWLNGVKIGCERFERFIEDDIKKMNTGIVRGVRWDEKTGEIIEEGEHEKFDDEDIKWIKHGIPPRDGMYRRMGFMMHMANLKSGLEEEGFLSYDEFDVKCEREDEMKLLCDFKDKTLTFR